MRKFLAAFGAVVLISGYGMAVEANIGYSTSSYAAQTSMGVFNTSVRDRLSMVRVGDLFLTGFTSTGRRVASLASEKAYGAAPSVRASNSNSPAAYGYNGETRRQLECVYTSGFSLWGDVYGAWERQRSESGNVGYKYHVGGPALGFDWTTGGLTLGIAATYNWGTIKNVGGNLVDNKNTRNTRTWALMAYGQYNARRWYANASLGYGETRFKSSLRVNGSVGGDRYRDNSWNMDAEFGMKFRFGGGFLVTPNIGLSYFHDRRGGFTDTVTGIGTMKTSGDNYNSLELPVGVNLAYEFATAGALIVPQLRFAWVPELARTKGRASSVDNNGVGYSDYAARRSRNAFEIGLGAQAKLNQTVSLHLGYDLTLRGRYYNHNLNLGVGVTF